jgi:hypothetical protein
VVSTQSTTRYNQTIFFFFFFLYFNFIIRTENKEYLSVIKRGESRENQ